MSQAVLYVDPFYVHTQITDFGRNLSAWVIRARQPKGLDVVLQVTPDGTTSWLELDEGARLPTPTFIIPKAAAELLIDSLQETLGVKKPDESLMQGRLEAMSLHLADMRRLVFEDDDDQQQR
jgi:hypothetical protein